MREAGSPGSLLAVGLGGYFGLLEVEVLQIDQHLVLVLAASHPRLPLSAFAHIQRLVLLLLLLELL